jgi:cytoskeletal protein CcmA (bactofilin family)
MSDAKEIDGTFINSIVGEGTTFKGDLNLQGLLRIDGDFTGSIKTPGKVLIGKNGRAECTINSSVVVVGGVVKGNVYASESVIALSTGMILGNVIAPQFIAEEGVLLNGKCVVNHTKSEEEWRELRENQMFRKIEFGNAGEKKQNGPPGSNLAGRKGGPEQEQGETGEKVSL